MNPGVFQAIRQQQMVSGVNLEPEYEALLLRSTVLGYTLPSQIRRAKDNAFIKALKDAGIWDLLDCLFVLCGETGNFSTLNWKSPTLFRAVPTLNPTFTPNQGYAGNGTNSYLTPSFIPSLHGVKMAASSAAITAFFRSGASTGNFVGSRDVASGGFYSFISYVSGSTSFDYRINGNVNGGTYNVGTPSGKLITSQISGAQFSLAVDGVQVHSGSGAGGTLAGSSLDICRSSGNAGGWSNAQLSLIIYSAALNALRDDLYSIWTSYYNGL